MKNFKRLTAIVLTFVIIALTLPTMSVFAADADMRYGRTKLDANLQKVYDKIVTSCANNSPTEVEIDKSWNISKDQLQLAFDMFYNDYPEYFWVVHGGYYYSIMGTTIVSFTPSYCVSDVASAKSAYNSKVNELTSGLNSKSDYEKSKILHDKLIDIVTYTSTPNDQHAYGALVEGKAVCNGYARAYQHLMNVVGIPTWYVTGSSINPTTGETIPHAWNLVKIDGQWYYTDVTWDDQGSDTFYAYFNITTKQLLEGHTIDTNYTSLLPQATATAANYYKKESREFTGYDQSKLIELLKKDNKKTQIYITDSIESFWNSMDSGAIARALGATGSFKVVPSANILGKAIILNFIITEEGHVCSPKATIPQVNATCLANGTKAYFICTCGAKYLDSACTQGVTNDSELVIKANAHTPSGWKNNTTNHWKECTKCGSETANTRGSHTDGNKDYKCDSCGYGLPKPDESGNIVIGGGSTANNTTDNSNNHTSDQKPNGNNSTTTSTDSKNESEIESTTDQDVTSGLENTIVDTDETTSTYEESYLYCGGKPNGIALKWILICGGIAIVVAAGIAVTVVLITKKKV